MIPARSGLFTSRTANAVTCRCCKVSGGSHAPWNIYVLDASKKHPVLERREANGNVPAHIQSSGVALVYSGMRPELLRFLTARLGDRAAADDALQQLWLSLLATDARPVNNPRAYLYRAAHNVALDAVRVRARRLPCDGECASRGAGPEPAASAPDVEVTPSVGDEVATLATAIAALPEDTRHAFRLHKLEELSLVATAARLGISRSGAEIHVAIALAQLCRSVMT